MLTSEKPTMNLTLKKPASKVLLSTLKPGDAFSWGGSSFVLLKLHPQLDGKIPERFLYAALPGDSTPFMVFGTNVDYTVEFLGRLVNSGE